MNAATKAALISEATEAASSEAEIPPDHRKVVGWEPVRQAGNRLVNGFFPAEATESGVLLVSAGWPGGVHREVRLGHGVEAKFIPAGDPWFPASAGWVALEEGDAVQVVWRSATSGCELEAVRLGKDRWELSFRPSPSAPGYRGLYYSLWREAE